MAIVGRTNGTTEKHESCVILTSSEYQSGVPRKCRSIKGYEYQPRLGACDEECGIIETQPRPVQPGGDVNDGKFVEQPPACGHEPMRRVLVSQQARLCRFLLHATCRFPRGTPSHSSVPG